MQVRLDALAELINMTGYRDIMSVLGVMTCDVLALEPGDPGCSARRRLEGKNTGTYEQAKYAVYCLLTEKL
jgi:hypothetical protein